MARFPFVPGTGAKSIKNPVYWTRLNIQEDRYSSRTRSAERQATARWLNINTALNYFICGWFIPLEKIGSDLSEAESKKLNKLFTEAINFRDAIDSDASYLNQPNLNKLTTRIKNFMLCALKLTRKYGLFDSDEAVLISVEYDKSNKDFTFIYSDLTATRRYFLGNPDPTLLPEIRRNYARSRETLSKDLAALQKKRRLPSKVPSKRPQRKVQKKTIRVKAGDENFSEQKEGICHTYQFEEINSCRRDFRQRLTLLIRNACREHNLEYRAAKFNPQITKILDDLIKLAPGEEKKAIVRDGRSSLIHVCIKRRG